MSDKLLPASICTALVICIWPLMKGRAHPKYLLLFFSLVCYTFISGAAAVVLLFFSLTVYFGGKHLQRKNGRAFYYFIVFICVLPLILYKAFNNHSWHIVELVGISYFTFNGLSYLFDIRKGYLVPETNYLDLLLYLSYFPCIAAGPVHRYKYLKAQFSGSAIDYNSENFSRGFRLVLWGLFKNLVLAERLKAIAGLILDNPAAYQGIFVMLGGLAFFFQLYCDFSSYVDISMGFSRMMGIQLSTNFSNRVYLSSSRREFWKGWHQTLNEWFRDYFFYPLVKGRGARWRVDLVLLLTFVLIGLWHEISWKFLVWGTLNGLLVLTETKLRERIGPLESYVWRVAGVVYHLLLASFMAVIFRTGDLMASWRALFASSNHQFSEDEIVKKLVFIIPFFVLMDQVNRFMKGDPIDIFLGRWQRWQRWVFYFTIALIIMTFGLLPDEGHYYERF